ncbi:MAG: organic solvent tolerance ABC transporter substrate-binding protein [candidate division NC10 bacterium RBG_16_65_8]|nr:MAG: organic solvent tolerance ABC transporter substrate-binding protein [candidate division NC10 bacterium RBG_16_65_8]
MQLRRQFARLTLAAILLAMLPVPAAAGEAMEQLRGSVDQVLQVLRDPRTKGASPAAERRARIRQIVDDRFDFTEMARRALAMHWAARTPQERRDFTALFSNLLERSYIDKIEAYTDERIVYSGERVEGDFAEVRTKLEGKKNLDVPLEYRLLRRDGKWWVYDVVIEGVSLIANYRTQFNKIIQSTSYPELVKRMQAKLESEEAGDLSTPTPRRP